jgi:predicted DsbA family dithiol-disulfide isomerase
VSEGPFVLWLYGDIFCSWTRQLLVSIRELQTGTAVKLQLGWRPLPLRPENEAALRAVEFARDLDRDLADRVLDGLCEAAAAGFLDAPDPRSLLAVCERLGLDGEGVRHAVSDGRYDAELTRAEDEAERYGIDRIPTILIGSRKIVGAAPTDLLAAEVEAYLASLPAENEGR